MTNDAKSLKAISLKEYIDQFAENAINRFDSILKFTPEELEEYNIILNRFMEINSSSSSTKMKGDILEEIVSFILNKSIVFEVYENVKTGSNEIDQLTRLNKKGHYFYKQGLLNFEQSFLCECKNYNQSVSVTWVGKFYSLMKVTKKRLGIIFSYNGLSGSDWRDGIGLTKKIYLSDEDNSKIIDFNINDFKKLADGESFIDLINNKIFTLENDAKIDNFISNHPNEIYFNS